MIALKSIDGEIILLCQREELREVDNTNKALIIQVLVADIITCAHTRTRELVSVSSYILFKMRER